VPIALTLESPNLGRRVLLFGQRALRAWVAIEADPTILEFLRAAAGG
jgi:hypothetical protein